MINMYYNLYPKYSFVGHEPLICLDPYYFSCTEHRVPERVVSKRYILKNTERVVSGLIQTEVLFSDIRVRERVVSKRYILKNIYLN